jgi:PAS domain S-box-containing protein
MGIEARIKYMNNRTKKHAAKGQADITEHRKTEEALRESEERFSKAFMISPYACMIAHMEDGAIVEVNEAFTTISGFTREEALAGSTLSLKVWSNPEDRRRMVADLRDGRPVTGREVRLRSKSGNVLTVQLSARLIYLGDKCCIISILEDISQRKKMEQELRDSESNYRTLMEQASDGIFIADMEGNYTDANLRACAMFGYSREEILHRGMKDLLLPEEIAARPIRFKELGSGEIVLNERRMRRKDGSVIYAEISGKKLADGRFQGIVRDITGRKQAEEALRESEEKYRRLVDNANQIIVVAQDGMIKFVNRKGLEVLGYSEQESLTRPFLEFVYPEDRHLLTENHARLVKGELIQQSYEFRVVTADGRVCWVEINPVPIEWKGRPATLDLLTDITERKRIESELQKAQKLESLGILAGGIAHDFNNLLTGIFGYIDLARSVSKDAQAVEYLETTIATMNRARALTQQLLTFAKGGSPVLKITPLIPFVREAVQFALSGSNSSCRFDLDKNLWPCNIDKNQIGQVIDNIVINAQQAMPNGGVIDVLAENVSFSEQEHASLAAGTYVKLSIKDRGVGIPKEILHQIFDPFFTTKTKGHGLGLSTCYSIVKRHGGCIDVESEPGKGSTFHVYLPASAETVVEDAAAAIRHAGKGTIIIMDDEEIIRAALQKMLGAMGYTVVCKSDGKEALDFYISETGAKRTFAAMILDLTVHGGMGGMEAVKEVRKLDAAIPVFVASGYADDPVMKNPVEYGFTASISKPFTMAELSEMLNKTMV